MKKIYVLITALIIISSYGCFGKTTITEELDIPMLELQDYAYGFDYVSNEEITAVEAGDTKVYDENYEVSYEKVVATSSYDELSSFGANNDIFFPGALIDFETMNPIQAKRNPITISMSLETSTNTGSGSLAVTIQDPKLSTVRDAIKNLVGTHITQTTNLPARLSYEVREVKSESEFGLNLGFGIQKSKFSLSENFSLDKIEKKTNIVVVLKQIYYTIDVDTPETQSAFFNLSNSEINDILDEGVIPTYVSSVAYGRIALISIQSNFSKREIENELSASWGKMSENPGSSAIKQLSVEFDSTLKHMSQDEDTQIKVFVYGGSAQEQYENMITSTSDFSLKNIFGSYDALSSVGMPISYTFRHVDGSLAKIQESNEYVIKNIEYKPKKIMNWDFYTTLVESEEIRGLSEFVVDVSSVDSGEVNQTIVIPSNIEKIVFYGDNDITTDQLFDKLSIKISNRTTPLEILIKDFSFSANDYYAIFSNSLSNVTLIFEGEVMIYGSTGYSAIKGVNVILEGNADISLFGGNGKDHEDGHSGLEIDNSLTINCTNILNITGGKGGKGEDGISYNREVNVEGYASDGRDGGNGSIGYPGGYAIIASELVLNPQNSLRLSLKSGDGGNGGNGGDGEFAGFDKSPTAQAGDGGRGGNGGFCGEIINANSFTVNDNFYSVSLQLGKTGDGGNGGNGGHSDKATFLFTLKWGNPGVKGNPGNYGSESILYTEEILTLLNFVETTKTYVIQTVNGSTGNYGEDGEEDFYK